MKRNTNDSRQGWTLSELLVTLGILAIIGLISLPAILSRRESSRRTACSDRLAQLAKAAVDFESLKSRIPSVNWYQEIMSYTESPHYNKFVANRELPDTYLEILICPSDTGPFMSDLDLYSNYLGTAGVWAPQPDLVGPVVRLANDSDRGVRWDDITDGRQTTALFSEVLRAGRGRLRTIWSLPEQPYAADQIDEFVEAADRLPPDPLSQNFVGHARTKGLVIGYSGFNGGTVFYSSGLTRSTYNHAAPPQRPSCHNGARIPESSVPASSDHKVVNVAFCDGHVESFTRDVNIGIWRSFASRAADD